MRDSLHRKLFLAFTGMAVMPLLLAGAFLGLNTYRMQERQTLATQQLVGRGIAAEFRNFLGGLTLELEEPARRHGLAGLDPKDRADLASSLLAFEPMLVDVAVLDPSGKVLSRSNRYHHQSVEAQKSLAHLPEVATALLSRVSALGNVRYDEATNEPVIGIAVPSIAPATGEVEGLLTVEARFRRVWELTAAQAGLSDITTYVIDNHGRIIAHRNPSVVLAGTSVPPVSSDGFTRNMSGDLVFMTNEAVVIGGRRFVVVVEQPLAAALRLPLRAMSVVGLVLLFAGIGAVLMVVHSRRLILTPLQSLSNAVRGVENGDLSQRAMVHSDDEIGALASSFNSMTQRVDGLMSDLRESEEKFRMVAESTSDAMVVIDSSGNIVSWNRGAWLMFGYSAEEALGKSLSLLMPEHMRDRHRMILDKITAVESRGVRRDPMEQPGQRKDGTLFPVEVSLATFMAHGTRYFSGIIRDITARKEAESNIRFLARHDALTGLANRPVLHEKLIEALARIKGEENQKVCLLFIDLDNFKYVNDILGHSFGDKLLRMVADRLRSIEGAQNTVCRHGGDEFILLAPGISGTEQAEDLAKQVLAIMSESFAIDDQAVEVGCSIGITLAPDDGIDPEELIRKADIAMYRAKDRGRLGYQVFTTAMDQQLADRRRLENKLRRGLKSGEITVNLQPKLSFVSGDVIGFEALARWNSPELGMVPPSQFIPVAEESGLIGALGTLVLRKVLETLHHWVKDGHSPLPVAVNLSAVQLRNPSLAAEIEAMLLEYEVPSELLELELTESMLMGDVDEVRAVLARLRALGIKLSIDDFGTGYSSLSYLKSFPLNVLKIDRSFVVNLPHDHEDVAICLAIINMAKALSLEVVAEGVETEAQAAFLRKHGCDFAQGYLYGRPDTIRNATHLLKALCEPNPADLDK